ncbi:hypothetical protein [Flavobacterium sp. B17]|uniref:hypothetical protein n=1 Tax=Flavobacterium sp. B17 TaxID=95618 RepID=UPI000348401C|nr:hypothetical protein [Flavobacterium sp. B17]
MENSKAPVFTMTIVAIIVGVALYKQFDFSTRTFEKPALSALYAITFLFAVFVLVRNYRKTARK